MIAEEFEDAKARYARANAGHERGPLDPDIYGPYLRDVLGLTPTEFSALDWATVQLELGYRDGKLLAEWVDAKPVDGKPHQPDAGE